MIVLTTSLVAAFCLLLQFLTVTADTPCWHAQMKENSSTVCVCTAEYCDEITRRVPRRGQFISYSSSECGLRFEKNVGMLKRFQYNPDEYSSCPARGDCIPALFLDSRTQYQEIQGFGGAVTDAVGINWNKLKDEALRQYFIDSYFCETGLRYNMMRVPIGGSDFSTHAYAYNEAPINDFALSNFTLTKEDFELKIPLIRKCFEAATTDVHIVATTWSPPGWMKDNGNLTGMAQLLPEHYQTYADYHLKFLQAYADEGIPIWGITTTNEPTNGIMSPIVKFNSLGWILNDLGKYIAKNLGPTIRNSTFKDVKILCGDDQRNHLTSYFTVMTFVVPEALQYIDGVAVHFYLDEISPPEVITYAMRDHPDKFIISTEACAGAIELEIGGSNYVDLGSWSRAQLYIRDIIEDLNFNATGWIDWNMCLDEQGGPNWVSNYVDSPIIIAESGDMFYKQPMYYAVGHASKFLPRGSRRIKVDTLCENTVQNVAFLTPENTVVTLLHNTGDATEVYLVTCQRIAKVPMKENSIVTVEFLYEPC